MKWGNIILAVIFAIAVIGTATATYFLNGNGGNLSLSSGTASNPNDTDGDGLTTWEERVWKTDPAKFDTDGDGAGDGAEIAANTDPLMPGLAANAYETWGGYTPSQSLGMNIASSYTGLSDAPTSESIQAAAKTVSAGITLPDLEEKIAYDEIKINDSMPIAVYGKLVYALMRESVNVREYELITFQRTVTAQNYYGTPALHDAARAYRSIEAGLLAMEIPPVVSAEHLAVVNAVGTLANTVSAMAAWSGDAFAGLAYTDAFLKAEARAQSSLTALFARIAAINAQ